MHILPKFSSGMGAELPPKNISIWEEEADMSNSQILLCRHSEGLLPWNRSKGRFSCTGPASTLWEDSVDHLSLTISLPSGSFFLVQHLLWLCLNWELERTEFPSCKPHSFNEPLSVTETWESESCLTVGIVKLFVCNPNLQFVFSLVIQVPQKHRIFLIYVSHVHPN